MYYSRPSSIIIIIIIINSTNMYSVSQKKVAPSLKLFAVFSLLENLCN